jgi:hypothetical protein
MYKKNSKHSSKTKITAPHHLQIHHSSTILKTHGIKLLSFSCNAKQTHNFITNQMPLSLNKTKIIASFHN